MLIIMLDQKKMKQINYLVIHFNLNFFHKFVFQNPLFIHPLRLQGGVPAPDRAGCAWAQDEQVAG